MSFGNISVLQLKLQLLDLIHSWHSIIRVPISSDWLGSPHMTSVQPPGEDQQCLTETEAQDKQRPCVIYLPLFGCWTGCYRCNILNVTGKAWCGSDRSRWWTVQRGDRTSQQQGSFRSSSNQKYLHLEVLMYLGHHTLTVNLFETLNGL